MGFFRSFRFKCCSSSAVAEEDGFARGGGDDGKDQAQAISSTTEEEEEGFDLESFFGPDLVTRLNRKNGENISTDSALQGQDLVALYFAQTGDPVCEQFSTILFDFCQHCDTATNFQIIYVSIDPNRQEWHKDYQQMPSDWLALPPSESNSNICRKLKIVDTPCMVVLNIQSGNMITRNAVSEIQSLNPLYGSYSAQVKNLVKSWRQDQGTPIDNMEEMVQPSNSQAEIDLLYFGKQEKYHDEALVGDVRQLHSSWATLGLDECIGPSVYETR